MVTLALKKAVLAILEQSGNQNAVFETDQIIKWALKSDRFALFSETEAMPQEAEKALNAANRRAKGEPLQYILGEWDFYGLTFHVGEGVLIPRPETEILTEKAVEILKKPNENGSHREGILLDLCSGSGCIPITAAKKTDAYCFGIELSEKALKYFNENIVLNQASDKVAALNGNVLEPSKELLDRLPEKCDVITANPPYLTDEEMENLQKEVEYEPKMALYGGTDGLDFYRVIFGLWKKFLSKNGSFIVETGDNQARAVKSLMEKEGFSCEIIKDYNKLERIVLGKLV